MTHNSYLITFIILLLTCSFSHSESTGLKGVGLLINPLSSPEQLPLIPVKDPTRIPENMVNAKAEQASVENSSKTEVAADNTLTAEKEVVQETPKEKEAVPIETPPEPVVVVASKDIEKEIKEEPKTVDPVATTPEAISSEEPKKTEENKEVKSVENPVIEPVNTPIETSTPSKDDTEIVKDESANTEKNGVTENEIPVSPKGTNFMTFIVEIMMIFGVIMFGLAGYYRYHLEKYRQAPFTPPSFLPRILFPEIGSGNKGYSVRDTYQTIEVGQYQAPGRHLQ